MNFDLLFSKAKEAGIEDLQIYMSSGTQFDIEVFNGELEKYTIADTATLEVKGIYDSKMGTVSTEVINDEIIGFVIDSIVASANAIDLNSDQKTILPYFLKEVAQDFHTWYNACHFIEEDAGLRNARLFLALQTAQVLRNGLALLGVSAPESM